MSAILAVAESVWRRILRMKVLYFLIACAVALIAITCMYKYLMAFEQRLLMVDVSLLLTSLSGLLCVLSLAFDIPRELNEGSAAALLSKPLGRTQYLIGKFLGISVVAVVVTGLITVGFVVVHYLAYKTVPADALKGHLLAVASVVPMAAIALLFASLLGEAGAAVLTFLVVFLLSSMDSIPRVAALKIVYGGIIPALELFNFRAEAAHDIGIPWGYVGLAAVWGIVYSIGMVAFAGLLFNRRDLK